jgi:uncharacterized protein YlxP (DUF503 family)
MTAHVLALTVEMHLADCQSLKAKRSILKSLIETTRRRFGVSVAETDYQQKWQRAELGVAVVAASVSQALDVVDEVEQFIWSNPEVQVLSATRDWLENS